MYPDPKLGETMLVWGYPGWLVGPIWYQDAWSSQVKFMGCNLKDFYRTPITCYHVIRNQTQTSIGSALNLTGLTMHRLRKPKYYVVPHNLNFVTFTKFLALFSQRIHFLCVNIVRVQSTMSGGLKMNLVQRLVMSQQEPQHYIPLQIL